MNAYKALAASYDSLTQDVDYDGVVEFYETLLRREGIAPRSAVDLACGTGSLTVRLAQKGYKVMGVDLSEDMLTVASQKAWDMGLQIPFVCQPLEKLYLPRGVDLAVCGLDSIDYITDPACCKTAIARIYRALNPGGCFIFDVDTACTDAISMYEYIHNMPTVMAAADVVISRAGASTCNEIAASGTPCILIPSPNVTDNHQEKNARALERGGGAVVVLEKDCTAQRLYEEVKAIVEHPERALQMQKALQKEVIVDSAERVCGIMEGLIKRG